MMKNLKVSRVFPCLASQLTSLVRVSDDTCTLTIPQGLTAIEPCQGATLQVKSDREDRLTVYTTTLSFITTRAHAPARNQCYICELTDGTMVVIGNLIAPYPASTYEDKHGHPGDRTSKLREVTAVWKATMPALEVV